MPAPPNSLIFDAVGDRAFAGSQFGAFVITPANFGGTTSPFTSLPASGTTLGLVTGKVLAVSSNGGTAIFSDTVSTPNRVYVVNSSSSTTSLNINSAIAAAFSPDGLKGFILGNGGNTLYVYSTLQSLQTYQLAAPATSIVFNSTGSFALLAGGSSPSTLAIRNTCDNSAVNLSITPGLPSPPLFLKMVPAGNVPMGDAIIPSFESAGLDLFFGLDNTGIDVIATNSAPGPVTTLCPQIISLAKTTQNVTFEPLHINIGFGAFHPINFFLSPDSTQAYIVTSDFGVRGVRDHAFRLDTPSEATHFHRRLVNACIRAHAQTAPLSPGQLQVILIGAGATGVELAAELHRTTRVLVSYGLDRIDPDKDIRLVLLEASDRILPALPERLSDGARKLLQGLGVQIRTSSLVKMRSPSNGICGSRVVSAPVAITIFFTLTRRELAPSTWSR